MNAGVACAETLDQEAINGFIEHMAASYQFDRSYLQSVFMETRHSGRVLTAISKPTEALPWYKYRNIFIQPARIDQGLDFWKQHEDILLRAEQEFGVPAQIIVAIIGVETKYGANTGNDRVIDALATLAFHYPKRGAFFRSELEQFLLLAREQDLDPLSLKGSYAGAMGLPQFIPSSFRNYAIDYDGDGRIDIWNNPADAIGSVANYFRQHGWEQGQKVVVSGNIKGDAYTKVLSDSLKPDIEVETLAQYGIELVEPVTPGAQLKVLSLEAAAGREIWLCLNNFYVITRYNHSALYAMAVYQLSEEILGKVNNATTTYGLR